MVIFIEYLFFVCYTLVIGMLYINVNFFNNFVKYLLLFFLKINKLRFSEVEFYSLWVIKLEFNFMIVWYFVLVVF